MLQSQQATNCCWLSYFITLGENVVEALKQYDPSQAQFCWILQLHSSKQLTVLEVHSSRYSLSILSTYEIPCH